MWNQNVVNLLEDDYGVVDAVTLWCIDESEVNVDLSDNDATLSDGKAVDKV